MYIGDAKDPSPLFNEVFDNALDEESAGFSRLTSVVVDYDKNQYSVTDYGRGFPQGKIHDSGTDKDIEALELLCTTAFSGGKFNHSAYKLSTGLHGVGLLVTNSLSKDFSVSTWRNDNIVNYKSSKGITKSTSYATLETNLESPSGTVVCFSPDPDMFETSKIPLSHIIMRCRIASAFGMKILVKVIENNEQRVIDTTSTIYDLLPQDDEGVSEYYHYDFLVRDEETGEFAYIALKYTSDTKSYYRGYTNLLYNSNGGSHHKMMDSAVYDAWNHFNPSDLKWNDIYLGLRAVVAVFISDPEFSSQSKERLSVDKSKLDKLKVLITDKIIEWLSNNNEIRESLIKRFQEYRSSQNKLLARKEIKSLLWVNNSKNGTIRRVSQVHKLRECDSKVREGTELFIVEGDSAVGSAIQARDSRYQAVIPVRGKVFNVARCTNPKDALVNEETRALVNVIGAGIGEDTDPEKSRYDKIIFMADADEDGKEIAVLLAGMFINLLPNLVKQGMVYISLPPLYGWKDSKDNLHFTNIQSEIPEKVDATRFKGLGEMDADELKVSTMDPVTRRLIKLEYPEDLKEFNSILTSSGVKYKMLEDSNVIREEF
jgi:DNA gyrase/topoisomerase IV subunit B